MSISKLPNECLQEIFSYIDRVKTLHSVILVNRKWCQNGIIRLWRKPFRNSIEISKQIKICPILINFIVLDKGLNIKEKSIKDYYKKFQKESSKPFRSSFNYPSFITGIDLDRIIRAVAIFTQKNKNSLYRVSGYRRVSKIDQVMTFVFVILRVIAFRGANIKRFIINLKDKNVNTFFDNEDAFEVKWDITRIKLENTLSTFLSMDATKRCLKNLRYFVCDILIDKSNILKSLMNTCTNLQGIKVQDDSYHSIKDSLISLIQNQTNLEHLHIQGNPNSESDQNIESNITDLVLSLEKNASSYKKILFENGYIDSDTAFKSLMNCNNLEILQIKDLKIPYKNFELLAFAEFPKLKCLSYINTEIDTGKPRITNPFVRIINNKNISSQLQKLHLVGFVNIENYRLLSATADNFKNLIDLCVQITRKEEVPLLSMIMKNCSMMKQIRLVNPLTSYNFKEFKDFIKEWSLEKGKKIIRFDDYGLHVHIEWE
ncbi:hypothetical protein RclHR1_08820008 [Rhizophagus clarus]|uniref:F-box domain-containing protein n=1 Tax=Rhizophagus clarus TaxID=94130 RepID=A0A2Z6SP08_9GLOM|nr:hypothetical protein RclHR1_08820008 [Rhizophagus clarus]GES91811.1 hypothetical protein GLOIN_2v1880949 [Rhizophagus clarus]